MTKHKLSVGLLAGAAAGAFANDASRFEAVLEANPVMDAFACAFTTTATSTEYPGEVRMERFTPDPDGGAWRLLAVDGERPSAAALRDYAKDNRSERRSPTGFDLGAMVARETVAVAAEDADMLTFAFKPLPDGERLTPKLVDKMSGTFVVARGSLDLQRFKMAIDEPVSPGFGFKMKRFDQQFTFAVEPVTGAAMVASMKFSMVGRAFAVKAVSVDLDIAFHDYDCRPAGEW